MTTQQESIFTGHENLMVEGNKASAIVCDLLVNAGDEHFMGRWTDAEYAKISDFWRMQEHSAYTAVTGKIQRIHFAMIRANRAKLNL